MYSQRSIYQLAALLLPLSILYVNGEVCAPGTLPNLARHGVSGRLCFINQTRLVIRDFSYDQGGPDAHLYYYGPPFTADEVIASFQRGGGEFIPHPATGNRFPFGDTSISGEDLEFSLPQGVFACDLAVFTIWCRLANSHFTAIDIPASLFTSSVIEAANNPDVILCNREAGGGGGGGAVSFPTPGDFDNCEQFNSGLSLSWTVNRSSESIEFMLCGCVGENDRDDADNTWLGFGLSGSNAGTLMAGADVSIVWVDDEEGPQAEDYYLSAYTQCRNGVGACPDTESATGDCSNDVTLLQGQKLEDQQCVVYSRNFSANDVCDSELDPDNENQYIVWGVGGLGATAFRHFIRAQSGDPPLHLGRSPENTCNPFLLCSSCPSYTNERFAAPIGTVFNVHIGPSGDQRGYMGITGNAGWGIAWYINGNLIPELVVERNQTYTFIIYGGDSPADAANYHPFYITNSSSGGRLLNDEDEQMTETVYAGFDGDRPTGIGPLCTYDSTMIARESLFNCDSTLSEYLSALDTPTSQCEQQASLNSFTWTPDSKTPDLVYYQCASHLNLGWRITVTDSVARYVEENPREGTVFVSGSHAFPLHAHASVWVWLSLTLTLLQMYLWES